MVSSKWSIVCRDGHLWFFLPVCTCSSTHREGGSCPPTPEGQAGLGWQNVAELMLWQLRTLRKGSSEPPCKKGCPGSPAGGGSMCSRSTEALQPAARTAPRHAVRPWGSPAQGSPAITFRGRDQQSSERGPKLHILQATSRDSGRWYKPLTLGPLVAVSTVAVYPASCTWLLCIHVRPWPWSSEGPASWSVLFALVKNLLKHFLAAVSRVLYQFYICPHLEQILGLLKGPGEVISLGHRVMLISYSCLQETQSYSSLSKKKQWTKKTSSLKSKFHATRLEHSHFSDPWGAEHSAH